MYSIVVNDVVVTTLVCEEEFAIKQASRMRGFATTDPDAHIGSIHNAGKYTRPAQSMKAKKAVKLAEINHGYKAERDAADPRRVKRREKRKAIRAAKTQEELDAITWS